MSFKRTTYTTVLFENEFSIPSKAGVELHTPIRSGLHRFCLWYNLDIEERGGFR